MSGRDFKIPRLVLCEGGQDVAFIRALIQARNLGQFDVRTVGDVGAAGSGVGGFESALTSIVTWTGFEKITRLVLLVDSDEHYRNSFRNITRQISRANRDQNVSGMFAIPTMAFRLTGGHPRLMIMLMPGPSKKGALETLLWEAIKTISGFANEIACVDQACKCAGIDRGNGKWPRAKLDKARVRLLIAIANRPDPTLGLGKLWARQGNLIPLSNIAFDDIANRLSNV